MAINQSLNRLIFIIKKYFHLTFVTTSQKHSIFQNPLLLYILLQLAQLFQGNYIRM